MLSHTNPDVNDAVINVANLVISRTTNSFFSMEINQCHKRLNKFIKGDGEAISFTEDEE